MSTIDLDSELTKAENFLDSDFSQFTRRVRDAARNNRLKAEPFLSHVDRANCIVRGLEVIFSIARANLVREDTYVPGVNDDRLDPPLSRASVESLLSLGVEVSSMFAAKTEDLSGWAEEYGVIGDQEANDERE